MIKTKFEYLASCHPKLIKRVCDKFNTTLKRLVCSNPMIVNLKVIQISPDALHLTVEAEAEKPDMRSLMQVFKAIDKRYAEEGDVKVTYAQIDNFALDDHDPKKKSGKGWDIPERAFLPKSKYRFIKL